MTSPIEIVEYDPNWKVMYEDEKRLIRSVLGGRLTAMEHVGSTSVPGLGGKPIIDIMASVARIDGVVDVVEPLEAIGYRYLPEFERFIPERRYFRKGATEPATHHLHVVERTTDFWKDHVLFREYLTAHPDEARAYEDLKRELATRITLDRLAFTDAKTPYIQTVLERAREWQAHSPELSPTDG